MKKLLSISIIAAMTVCTANATERGTRVSDVVRMMEENPEYIDTAADAIVTARAVYAAKKLNLKPITSAVKAENMIPIHIKIKRIMPKNAKLTYDIQGNLTPHTEDELMIAINQKGNDSLCNTVTMRTIINTISKYYANDTAKQIALMKRINNVLSGDKCWFTLEYNEEENATTKQDN